MEYGKYIIKEIRGIEVAIMFSHLISHCDIGIKGNNKKAISAGFFGVDPSYDEERPNDVDVYVWGKSVTLKIDSRPEDAELIRKVL